MIAAKDLRIGNKIRMVGSKNMVNTVFDISDNTRRNQIEFKSEDHKRMYSHLITVEENGNQYKPFEIEGIPLTEEILIKSGWVWNEECKSYEKFPNGDTRMHLQFRDVSNSYTMFNYILKAIITERLFYVHQLQNIYYDLKGEELTINL